MEFGYYLRKVYGYREIRDLALLAESYGFDSVHVDDHLIGFDPEGKQPYLEATVLMSAIAIETNNIKIGHIVMANSFRNPAITAKIISSIDNISNGRALLWIGAGWFEKEYKAYGISFPSARQRVDELEEAISILKKLFTEEVTSFEGRFWRLEECKNYPKPIQKPWPQIVIGGVKNRLASLACREADGFNIDHQGLSELKERVDFILSRLAKYGKSPEDFEISSFNSVTLVDNHEELDGFINQMIEHAKSVNKKLSKKQIIDNFFIGYVEDIKEKLKQAEDIGIDKMVLAISGGASIKDILKLFHQKVMR